MIYVYSLLIASVFIAGPCSLQATENGHEKNKFKQVFQKILSYKPKKIFKKFKKKKKVSIHPQNWQENLLHDPSAKNRKQDHKTSFKSYKSSSNESSSQEVEKLFYTVGKEDEKDPFASIEEQILLAQKSLEEEKASVKKDYFLRPSLKIYSETNSFPISSNEPLKYVFQECIENLSQTNEQNETSSSTLEEKESHLTIQNSHFNTAEDEFQNIATSSEKSAETTEESLSKDFTFFRESFSGNRRNDLAINFPFGLKERKQKKFFQDLYKRRLFLGEADFSYTLAVLKKHAFQHPNLAQAIIATELRSKEDLSMIYKPSFSQNIQQLKQYGVKLVYGIDATQIAKTFPERYTRIHFNFPHNRCPAYDRSLSQLLARFFLSATKIQNKRDRIHVTLPHVKDSQENLFKQAYVYGLYDASYAAGYDYLKKRRFDQERYPGYRHRITDKNSSAKMAREGREYIFVKVNAPRDLEDSSLQKRVNGKRCERGMYNCLPYQETDSESTSYEDHSKDLLSSGEEQ